MTIQLELDPATEARLKAAADLRGLAVEEYAGALLRESLPVYATGTGKLTPESLREMMTGLAKWSDKMPVLPLEANDRESFYEDLR